MPRFSYIPQNTDGAGLQWEERPRGDRYQARPVLECSLIEFDPARLASPKIFIEVVLEADQTVLMFASDLKTLAVPER
jgi:hypothetical protein